MDNIELMISEHDNILRMLRVVQAACEGILEGKEVCVEDFRNIIVFIREYADKHHHGKEEKILFKEMVVHLGNIGNNLITHGMLVEHDLGRLYILELETALNEYEKTPSTTLKLDILANAISYTKLLKRHIDKENDVVYTYGRNKLSKEIMADIEIRTTAFEKEATKQGIQTKYLNSLKELEVKYFK